MRSCNRISHGQANLTIPSAAGNLNLVRERQVLADILNSDNRDWQAA